MLLFISSDHAGFELKEKLKTFLSELRYEVVDKGAFNYRPEDDYPDFIVPVAEAVSADPAHTRGIILGGSGQGEAIVANRFRGVRAAVFYGGPEDIIRLSREHNDANILSLGARFLTVEKAKQVVKSWLEIAFSGDQRHIRRLKKIDDLEI